MDRPAIKTNDLLVREESLSLILEIVNAPQTNKPYETNSLRWQSLVDGSRAKSDGQPLNEDAVSNAQQNMLEHRENCEACKREDLALKEGEVPTSPSAETS